MGFALPYSQFVPWAMVHGLDVPLFFRELFSTHIGGFFGMDVIVSAIVLVLFVFIEGHRLGMQKLWVRCSVHYWSAFPSDFRFFCICGILIPLSPTIASRGTRHKAPRPSSETLATN
jgi:hypothetical protein